jgi:hypothetical protein
MADLIDTLGAKSQETKSSEIITNVPKVSTKKITEDNDLIAKVGTKGEISTDLKTIKSDETKPQLSSSEDEPSGTDGVKDPDSWTKDSALKEIKRLREENKTYRVKYAEKVDSLKAEMDKRLSAKESELQESLKTKKELDDLKARELDKERNLSEKLANREALLAELKTKFEANEKIYNEKVTNLQSELSRHQVEVEAQKEIYKQRLQQKLESVPEKFKDIAALIVKGAGDPRDALTAIEEADLRGVFEDKTVVVNHSVPGASQGARASKEKLENIEREERNKMTSAQKIKAALKGLPKSGRSIV